MPDDQDAARRVARDAAAAAAFAPPVSVRRRERRRLKGSAALGLLVLAVLGFASYEFVTRAAHPQHPAAATPPGGQARAVPVSAPSVPVSPGAGSSPGAGVSAGAGSSPGVPASPATAGTAPASATTAPASPPAPRVLTPVSVAAFGPDGTADGENPQNAALAVAGDPATPWYSDWYASPDFSDLPPGTGLLLDMGRTVTITSVRVSLDSDRGADLQLRAGGSPTLSGLPQLVGVSDAGGTVQLQPGAPARARYVLIWFTQLPPDPAGTYQARVYQVIVRGQS